MNYEIIVKKVIAYWLNDVKFQILQLRQLRNNVIIEMTSYYIRWRHPINTHVSDAGESEEEHTDAGA